MTAGPLVDLLVKRLVSAGYTQLQTPFLVASVQFEFTAALHGGGGRALDLVLIVDTATGDHGDRDGTRVRHRIEALSRALDITHSRYLLTVILAGATLQYDMDALSVTCRVLNVEAVQLDGDGRPVDLAATEALDDYIRVLLPLDLPHNEDESGMLQGDAIGELLATLPTSLDQPLVKSLVDASLQGDDAVTAALGGRLTDVLTLDDKP